MIEQIIYMIVPRLKWLIEIIENIPVGIYIIDPEDNVTLLSTFMINNLGAGKKTIEQ